jgi:cytochrome d ubiquinol oxidase subunit II
VGGFWTLITPYTLLVGALAVALFCMHGAIFLTLKTPEGSFSERLRRWMWHSWGVFLVLYLLTTMYTLVAVPSAVPDFSRVPTMMLVVLVSVLAIANIPRAIYAGRPGQAFLSSCLTIVSLLGLAAVALWPNLVLASNVAENSMTVYRAASSDKTLMIMFIIAVIGMPFVLAYTAVIYWTFRGKVQLGDSGY